MCIGPSWGRMASSRALLAGILLTSVLLHGVPVPTTATTSDQGSATQVQEVDSSDSNSREFVVRLSPADVAEDFRDDGRFVLPVPGLGDQEVVAVEEDLFPEEGGIFVVPEGDTRADARRLDVRSLHVEGRLVDQPASEASLLLGEQGVYGTITTPSYRYDYGPVETASGWQQRVVQYELALDADS